MCVGFADKTNTSGRILRFDSSGNFLDTVATQDADFTGDPESLTVGPDGHIYMSVAFGNNSDKIYKIDTDTGSISTLISTDFSAGESLDNPRGIEFAPNGDIYVADRNNDAIRRFRGSDGEYLGDIESPRQPQALAWDDAKNQFVYSMRTTSADTDIVSTKDDGSLTETLYTDTDIGLALGIEVVDGDVYWSDFNNGKIYQALPGQSKIIVVDNDLNSPSYMTTVENISLDAGESSWKNSGSGEWADPANWFYWGRADTNTDLAVFGSGIESPSNVTTNGSFTLRGMRFRNSSKYVLSGLGELTIDSEIGNGTIEVQLGDHEVDVDVRLMVETDIEISSGTSLAFGGVLDLNGSTLDFSGLGTFLIEDIFKMGDGTLTVHEGSIITFDNNIVPTLDGTLQFIVDQPLLLVPGNSFNFIDGVEFFDDSTFNNISLPQLDNGLSWDTTTFYTNGTVTVIIALAGDFNSDGKVDAEDYLVWKSTFGSDTDLRADGNDNGIVDAADYTLWRDNISSNGAAVSLNNTQIPEPTSLVLLIIASHVGTRAFSLDYSQRKQ